MSTPAAIPWVQFAERVVGEGHPVFDDVDNRPLKFIITQSDFDKTADFPGFLVRYIGIASPEGVLTATVGTSFIDTAHTSFYVKTTGAGNTGWTKIGGNLSGNGSPEGVAIASVGQLYEQRDAAANDSPIWVKRTGTSTNTLWQKSLGYAVVSGIVIGDGISATKATGTLLIGATTFTVTPAGTGNANRLIAINPTVDITTSGNGTLVGGIFIGKINFTASGNASDNNIFIGDSNVLSGFHAGNLFVIGTANTVGGNLSGTSNAVQIGSGNVTNASDQTVQIGQTNQLQFSGFTQSRQIQIGGSLTKAGDGSTNIQIGYSSTATTTNDVIQIGFGHASTADGTGFGRVVSIGRDITTAGSKIVAIGYSNQALAAQQIVIGNATTAVSTATGGIYIGGAITVTAAAGINQIIVGNTNSTGTQAGNILIGNNLSMVGGSGVAIGGSITVGGSAFSVAIMASVTSGAGGCVNIAGTVSGTNAVSIGTGSSAAATAVGIGSSASTGGQATGAGSIAVGAFCTASAGESLAIGFGAGSSHASAICLGRAQSIQTLEFAVGGGNGQISQFRFNQDTKAAPTAMVFRQENASGSNIAGASWTFIASRNTGNGASGQIIFQVGAVNGTAATLGVATTTFIVDRTVAVGAAVATQTSLSVTIAPTASGGVSRLINAEAQITAAANGDVMCGIRSAPTVSIGAFTGTIQVGVEIASITGAANNFAIRSATARSLFGTTTTSTFNTGGIVINQGGADDEILSFKSSDVAHGITTLADTDTYGNFKKISPGNGGIQFEGYSAGITSFLLAGTSTTTDTTRSNAAVGCIDLFSSIKSGTTRGSVGANVNMVTVRDNGTCRFILDSDGDSHQDVGTAWTNFDTHDDVQLLNKLSAHVTRRDDPLRQSFGRWLNEGREELEKLKLVSFNDDGHHFVNMSRLTMLHTGAIRQLAQKFERIEKALMAANLLPAGV